MNDEIKQRLKKSETWQRVLYMLFFIVVYGFSKVLVFSMMLFQFLAFVIIGKTNERLLKFSQSLCTFIYQIMLYLTFVSEQRPFPFGPWPKGAPEVLQEEKQSISE